MTIQLYRGDCLEVLPTLEANSVDAIVCDPPYGLSFMGKDWDHGVPGVAFWEAALRVAKPGAFLLAFGGDRTHHRLMVAIEDAGWEIRTCLYWLTGQGFPKSHDIHKSMSAKTCNCEGSTVPYIHEKETRFMGDSGVRSMRQDLREEGLLGETNEQALLLKSVQRSASGGGVEEARSQGACQLDGIKQRELHRQYVGGQESSL